MTTQPRSGLIAETIDTLNRRHPLLKPTLQLIGIVAAFVAVTLVLTSLAVDAIPVNP